MDFVHFFLFFAHMFSIVKNLVALDAIVAINAGGPSHTDVHGVTYQEDTSDQGFASDYGKRYIIDRVHPSDLTLYQTERYALDDLEYELSAHAVSFTNGDYTLVLKFSEVYFEAPKQKIFSVKLNNEVIVEDLDIFARVGRAVAHDEIIPFTVVDKKLRFGEKIVDFNGQLKLTFLKTDFDNPKINAFYIIKGTPDDVPLMPASDIPDEFLPQREEPVEEEPEVAAKFASGPQISDPYAQQEASQMFIPVLVALACFFPVLFCLCRL